jgi:hypothetical protein
VWLYHSTRKKEKLRNLQTCSEGPYISITRINIMCCIQQNPRVKMMVVNRNRLAPYLGDTRDE